jgi:ketosteroid isomerase-like protein
MAVQSENERNKAVVDEYFKAGVQGHLTSFAAYLHPDFTVTAPNYLPWGGRHVGAAFFRNHLLPSVTDVFDFARFSYDTVVAARVRYSHVSLTDPHPSRGATKSACYRIPHGCWVATRYTRVGVNSCKQIGVTQE